MDLLCEREAGNLDLLLTLESLTGRGNTVLVSIAAYNLFLYLGVKQYYIWRNKSKDKEWKKLSPAEQLTYLETTKAEGNKRLDFRFVH